MKGIIKSLPEGQKDGSVQKQDRRGGTLKLRQADLAAVAPDLPVKVGLLVEFDEQGVKGVLYAVNLRAPEPEASPAEPTRAAPATPARVAGADRGAGTELSATPPRTPPAWTCARTSVHP